jgi:hypothetical protein
LFLEEIDELHLPQDEYVISGSAPLVIRGIKKHNDDIDILVTKKLWNTLIKSHKAQSIIIGDKKIEYIQYNHIAILNSMLGFREEEYESIIERADTIGAYRFVNLNDTIICKNFSGRDKDIKQIELIEEYLKNTE